MKLTAPKPCHLDDITREQWIAFKWKSVYVLAETAPLMFCIGEADAEGAEQRGRDWDMLMAARKKIVDG